MRGYLGKAIVDGRLRYASVSSVKLFDPNTKGGCPRKWANKYILGLKEPESDNSRIGKEKGTALDIELKHYLATGEKNLSALAIKGLHILETPGPDLGLNVQMHTIEHYVLGSRVAELPDGERYPPGHEIVVRSALDAGGVPFVGELDVVHARGHYRDDDGEFHDDPPNTVEVGDIKFKSKAKDRNGNSTMLMPTDLVRDIQMAGYGEWVGRVRPETEHLRLSLLYFPEKDAFPTKVTKLHVLDDCRRTWEYVGGVVRSMTDVAKETDIERVPGNVASCDAYGGCPWRDTCSAYRRNSLDSLYGRIADDHVQEKQQMGLLASNPQIMQNAAPAPNMQQQLAQEEEAMRRAAAQQQQQMPIAAQNPAQLAEVCTRLGTYGFGMPSLAGNAAQAYAAMGGQSIGPGFVYGGIAAPPGARRSLHTIQLTEVAHIFQLEGELAAERAAMQPAPTPPAFIAPPAPAPTTAYTSVSYGSILPPGAPESQPALAQARPPEPTQNGGTGQAYILGSEPAAAPVTAPKKGRPKKPVSDVAPEVGAAVHNPAPQIAATPQVPTSSPVSATPVTPAATSTTTEPFTDTSGPTGAVLVNARFASVHTKSLAPYVDYINAELAKRYCVTSDGKPGVQDVRCAPKDSPLAFGGWKGAVREVVKADPPPMDAYHLDTFMDELNEVVADALRVVAEQRGWLYVRGTR